MPTLRSLGTLRALQREIPDGTTRARIASAGAVALIAGLVVALAVWQAADALAWLDEPVGRGLFDAGVAHPVLVAWASAWSFVVDGPRNIAIVAIAADVLVLGRAWPWAVFLVLVTQSGVIGSNLLKLGIARPRPDLIAQAAGQTERSFPSGHAFAGVTVWGSLALAGLYLLPRPWGRAVAVGCLALGLLQPLARLILGRHWLTDTIGGQLLGAGWLLLGWSLFAWWLERRAARDEAAAAGGAAPPAG